MQSPVVFAAVWLPLAAFAEAPLDVTNYATLARGFPLPVVGYTQVLAPGHDAYATTLDLVNEFHADSSITESVRVDGETQRLSLAWRHGFAGGWEAGVELPFYLQNGGILDDVVTGFHSLIGQSNASREQFPPRQYVFRYERPNGNVLIDRQRGSNVIGDLNFFGGWQLRPDVALRAQLKLPTGPSSALAGNGATSASVWADYAMPWFDPQSNFSGFASAGTGYAFLGDVLPDMQARWILFGGGGLAWRVASGVRLLAQVYGHSPIYKNSGLSLVGESALIQSVGVRWKFASGTEFQFTVLEDNFVSPAPDFAIRLGLNWGH